MLEQARQLPPTEVGMENIDLSAIALKTGQIIDLGAYKSFLVYVKFTLTGATTTGIAELQAQLLDDEGNVIIAAQPILSVLTTTATAIATLLLDGDIADLLIENFTATVTVGTNARKLLRNAKKIRFLLDITEAYNSATSAIGNVKIIAKP